MDESTHAILVKLVSDDLENNGEELFKPQSYIRWVNPDIVSYSEPNNMSRPCLKIIEIKDDKDDLQRAFYQLLASRESLLMDRKNMYLLMYVALSSSLYNKLIVTSHLDVFLKIMTMSVSKSFFYPERPDESVFQTEPVLKIGVVVLDKDSENPWDTRNIILESSLMVV